MTKDTPMLVVVSIAALAFMGFLYWKSIQPQQTLSLQSLQPKTTFTEFVRDKEGRVIQIIERG